jgi:succinate dehydrogenase / fumarate reductase flavoprotein subunit
MARANEELESALDGGDEDLKSVETDLAAAMWECCGVVRDQARLTEGERRLGEISTRSARTAVRSGSAAWGDLARRLDLRSGVTTAAASLRGAGARTETRGCHNRSDFPEVDPALQVNFVQRLRDDGSVEIHPEPVPPIPEEIERWIEETPPIEESAGLLE